MPILLPSVDHLAIGVSKIAEQYKGKPRITMWILCFLQQVQYIEDAIAATVNVWDLETATGWRLDILGARVGQARIGSSEAVFRLFIRARIRANRSIGKIKDLIDVANLLIGVGLYSYRESTGNVFVNVDPAVLTWATADELTAIQQMLQRAAPGGVRVWFEAGLGATYQPYIRRAATQASDVPGGHKSAVLSSYVHGLYSEVRA